ncbi:MAG: PorT family protein [Chitinophagales bacterium]|nr:PorT family protein [Chitinophagaceae bacterium]MBP9883268.1 PorT family protein [Chitinophagales bacterium]
MHTTNFRNQFYLFRKETVTPLLLLMMLLLQGRHSYAQVNIYKDEQVYQSRMFHFGISLAVNSSNYKITLDPNYLEQNEILEVHALSNPGFALGIISDLHLSKSFELRFIPDLAFADRSIQYALSTSDTIPIKTIESVYLEFPVHLKYRSRPYKDIRLYILSGFKYSIDMQSNATARLAENLVKVYRNDVAFEYGMGVEFHLPLVIISPEIKVSYGLLNVLKPDDNLNFSSVIEKLRARSIMFTLHFEG